MLICKDDLFEKTKLLSVNDILFSCSSLCENVDVLVFVIRSGDVVLYGSPTSQHHPVIRWLPWFDDVKKKICALTLQPNGADWALITCQDKSIYLIPVNYLLGFEDACTPPSESWQKNDITLIKSPLSNESDFIPSAIAWFDIAGVDLTDRHIAVVGSTLGNVIVFSLLSLGIIFRTKVTGRIVSIEICNRVHQIYIIISNDDRNQWQIILNRIDNDIKEDNASDTSDEKGNSIELKSVTSEKVVKPWKMKFKNRLKKPSAPLTVDCGMQEAIMCEPHWQLTVKIQNLIESSLNAHVNCLSASYPSRVLTIEDFSSHITTVHKLPEETGHLSITKSFIICSGVRLNNIKVISRNLSSCKDESKALHMEFASDSLLEEYIFDDEIILKIFCTDYSSERSIIVTNRAFYLLKLKTDPHKLVLTYILEKDNLPVAEKISIIFNLDLQRLISEAGDIQLSKGRIKEAVQLYNLTRSGGAHLILMLAVLGHMPELYEALKTCHYSPSYKLHFMNLRLLVSLHQFMTKNSVTLRNEFRDLLLQSGYDEALAVSVLAQAGLCGELLFFTKMKGLHPITMNVVISIVQHYQLVNISHCKGFWYLISDLSFCDTLLMKPQFLEFHQKLVQKNLPHLGIDIIQKLEALYNPFSVPLRSWILSLCQADMPVHSWVQTYILICTHLSARERKFHIDTIGRISHGQDWNFINTKLGIHEETLSAGFYHAVAVIDGNAYSWGSTSFGCLGSGPTTRLVSGPVFIDKFYNIGVTVITVSCGRNHTLALTENGVYSWGNNKYGQLGNGDIIQAAFPTLLESLSSNTIIQIVAGQYHSIALDNKKRVFTWGWGIHGQLGHGDIEDVFYPKIVTALAHENITWCAAGQAHSLFLSESGRVWACGSNAFGQLGTGKNKKSSIPMEIIGLTGVIKNIAVGYFHNFALSWSGELFAWGCSPNVLRTAAHSAKRKMKSSGEDKKDNNSFDDSIEYFVPRTVDISALKEKIVKVSAGSEHNALLTEGGSVYTWGRNMDGQLGIKTSSLTERRSQNVLLPTRISLVDTQFKDISCGFDFTIAMDIGGNVWTWGANHYSSANKNALSSLEGEIVIVNNKNRVIKLPHNAANVQPLPTLLRLPIVQRLIRKDLKPLLPMVLKTNNWRYRMHYAIETLVEFYNSPGFIQECLAVGDKDAAAKLLQVNGDISSALKITLSSAIHHSETQPSASLKSIISYYFSNSFLHPENFNDFLVDVITFWNDENIPFAQLEDIFDSLWKGIAIPLGDLFFRTDSKYSHLSNHFSTKFKLGIVEFMVAHKSNNIDCIFEGCSNIKEVLSALSKSDDYADLVIDQSGSSKENIVFKECSTSSHNSDVNHSN